MLRRKDPVFVSVARGLPLVWTILDALQVTGLAPNVYGGVDRPKGEIVSNIYIEARNELLESKALILVLGVKDAAVSDDWALDWIPQAIEAGKPVLIYLVPTTVQGRLRIEDLPKGIPIYRAENESDLLQNLTISLANLVESDSPLN